MYVILFGASNRKAAKDTITVSIRMAKNLKGRKHQALGYLEFSYIAKQSISWYKHIGKLLGSHR